MGGKWRGSARRSRCSPVRRPPVLSALSSSRCLQGGRAGEGVGLPGGQWPGRFPAAGAPPHPQLQGTAIRLEGLGRFFLLPPASGPHPRALENHPPPPARSPPVAAAFREAAVNRRFLRAVGLVSEGRRWWSSEKGPRANSTLLSFITSKESQVSVPDEVWQVCCGV